MTTTVLIPAQRFRHAKSRLAPLWDDETRAALAEDMLAHVLRTVAQAEPSWLRVVLTNDDDVARCATALGARVQHDVPQVQGHGAQLRHAAAMLPPDDVLVVLMADLPVLQADDIAAFGAQVRAHDVVLAPDRRLLGTNAASFRHAGVRALHFGHADSFLRHRAAFDAGADVVECHRAGFALDVDDHEDVAAITAHTQGASWIGARWLFGSQPKR